MVTDPTPRLCGDRGCTEPAYRCDGCGETGCMDALRKACRCEGGPDESSLYDESPVASRDHGDRLLADLDAAVWVQDAYSASDAAHAAEIAALPDADDASPEGMVCVMGDPNGPATVDEVVARLTRENVALRAELDALACAVRREHNTRLAWLATLRDGSCGNPPPQALLDAEAATREALRRVP